MKKTLSSVINLTSDDEPSPKRRRALTPINLVSTSSESSSAPPSPTIHTDEVRWLTYHPNANTAYSSMLSPPLVGPLRPPEDMVMPEIAGYLHAHIEHHNVQHQLPHRVSEALDEVFHWELRYGRGSTCEFRRRYLNGREHFVLSHPFDSLIPRSMMPQYRGIRMFYHLSAGLGLPS
jgi:hypothetical protein